MTAFGNRLGGSDNILWSFLRTVDRTRIEPTVIFLEAGSFVEEVSGLGMGTAVLPSGRLRDPVHLLRTVARLARMQRALRPDLVLNWLSTTQVSSGLAALLTGKSAQTLWWQLDLHTDGPLGRGHVLDRVASAIPSRAIGACSEAAAQHQRQIRPARPTFAVLPGIPEPPALSGERTEELRSELGPVEGVPVVGTIGRLFAWKGHDRMLEAVARLNQEGIACQALIVGGGGHRGDGDYEDKLRRLSEELPLTHPVLFTGQVPRGTDYLNLMDVFVNCSEPEPFGLVIVEAMASRTAAVAVDAGGPAEIIQPGESGVLARSGSAPDIAEALRPLLEQEDLRLRLADGGRQRFEGRFREKTMTLEMTERLEELARGA